MRHTAHAFSPSGTLRMQPSKSVLHRALICAALAKGESEILNFAVSDDISATMGALEALGLCHIHPSGSACRVEGGLAEKGRRTVDCHESGSTLRMLFPLGLDGKEHVFVGRGRLLERPFGPFERICEEQGIPFSREPDGIHVKGTLAPGVFELPGNVSSQFVSGLLLALPRFSADSQIRLTTPLESAPYVAITCDVLSSFGVRTEEAQGGFLVPGGQAFLPGTYVVEGDYSHAAFFVAAAALAGDLTLCGLRRESLQGDEAILGIVQQAGAAVEWEPDNESVRIRKDRLRPFEVDVSQIPDLVPVLAVLACGAKGTSRILNAGRLRFKESDRLGAMQVELSKMGADVRTGEDFLEIEGNGSLRGAIVDSHNDHRVAMALCVASLIADSPVTIEDMHVTAKSAPQFLQEWEHIEGGSSL